MSVELEMVLLPSPLLGPAVWRPVAEVLEARGWAARVAARPDAAPRVPSDVEWQFASAVPKGAPVVLVGHGDACAYLPALTATRPVAATIYVDGPLPPESGEARLASEGVRERLAGLADEDGMLPPWLEWLDPPERTALVADPDHLAEVASEQHRLPVSYFDAVLSVPDGWRAHPAAYLGFGDRHAEARDAARRWGWPNVGLPGDHLHMLQEPEEVAATLDHLAARQLWHLQRG